MEPVTQTPMLSVIIPLGPEETDLGRLQGDLQLLPAGAEILLVCCPDNQPFPHQQQISATLSRFSIKWLVSVTGRAKQLNCGTAAAKGRFLWYLHVDSGFGPLLIQNLLRNLNNQPQGFHFSPLAFAHDGPGLIKLNQWGANLRSRWLGVPFGDQGFCLSRENMQRLGGYPEQVAYGEDHLLLWKARQHGLVLCCGDQALLTSARKYRCKGWGKLTLLYQHLWLRQALPQWWRCLTKKGEP
ncbi:MAG: hypothetical protein V7739_18965 [Motiliproteus sp.]